MRQAEISNLSFDRSKGECTHELELATREIRNLGYRAEPARPQKAPRPDRPGNQRQRRRKRRARRLAEHDPRGSGLPIPARIAGEDVECVRFEWPKNGYGLNAVCKSQGKTRVVDIGMLEWIEPLPKGHEWIEAYFAWRDLVS